MGTRGAFGVIIGEKEKIAYNHFDSYPDGKGVEVLRWLRTVIAGDSLTEVKQLAARLNVVDDETSPATPEQIKELGVYANWHVGQFPISGPPDGAPPTEDVTWYNLLRETQGDLSLILS